MGCTFSPPTVDDGARYRADADAVTRALFRHFQGPTRGRTIIKTGATYVVSDAPYLDDLLAADAVYYGGHVHPIDDDEVTALTAAGYGAYITCTTSAFTSGFDEGFA